MLKANSWYSKAKQEIVLILSISYSWKDIIFAKIKITKFLWTVFVIVLA